MFFILGNGCTGSITSTVRIFQYAVSDKAVVKPFDVNDICQATCQITNFQDQYFYTNNFEEATDVLR